jgi:O-Antigen ligase
MLLFAGVFGAAALFALGAWFRSLIVRDRSTTLAVVLLSLLLLESVLYAPIDVPRGLFHLYVGSFQIRTLDLVLLVAVVARLTVRTRRPLDLVSGAWLAFAVWLVLEAYLGRRAGNPSSYIQYEIKTLLYLGVAYVLAQARVDRPRDLVIFARFCKGAAVAAAVLLVTSLGGVQVALGGGLLQGAVLGQISSISATLFPIVGVLAVVLFLCTRPLRYDLLISAVVLFATVAAPAQRASPLQLAVELLAILLVVPLGRRHLRITLTQFLLGAAAILFVAGGAWVAQLTFTGNGTLPFAHEVGVALHGGQKKLSAEDRLNQIASARSLIDQHPVLGYGLGKTIVYYEPGFKEFVDTYLTHNILTDLLLRTGAVGALLFLLAFWLSLNEALLGWRSATLTSQEAAFALVAFAVLIGWFTHGMVESLFEHVRITPFSFALLGLSRAAVRGRTAAAREAVPRRPPTLRAVPRAALLP